MFLIYNKSKRINLPDKHETDLDIQISHISKTNATIVLTLDISLLNVMQCGCFLVSIYIYATPPPGTYFSGGACVGKSR